MQVIATTYVGTRAVKIPMMPKGVEHKKKAVDAAVKYYVKIPMMPKGVEHTY